MKLAYSVLLIPGEPEEKGYWVKVPALPGCVTQGETVEECLTNVKEAIEGYILSLKARNLPIPEQDASSTALISMISVEV